MLYHMRDVKHIKPAPAGETLGSGVIVGGLFVIYILEA